MEACGILGLRCGMWELFKVSNFGKYENSTLYLHIEHSVGGRKLQMILSLYGHIKRSKLVFCI